MPKRLLCDAPFKPNPNRLAVRSMYIELNDTNCQPFDNMLCTIKFARYEYIYSRIYGSNEWSEWLHSSAQHSTRSFSNSNMPVNDAASLIILSALPHEFIKQMNNGHFFVSILHSVSFRSELWIWCESLSFWKVAFDSAQRKIDFFFHFFSFANMHSIH